MLRPPSSKLPRWGKVPNQFTEEQTVFSCSCCILLWKCQYFTINRNLCGLKVLLDRSVAVPTLSTAFAGLENHGWFQPPRPPLRVGSKASKMATPQFGDGALILLLPEVVRHNKVRCFKQLKIRPCVFLALLQCA